MVDDLPVTLGRGDGVLGEVVLRRRPGRGPEPVFELIVNGVFLMDTADTSTETMLADTILRRHSAPRRILVGGLGLRITTGALLADARVEHIVIAEIEPLLVGWLESGIVPAAERAVKSPRVEIVVADVVDVLRNAADHSYDAILLDVDNGPGFLVSPRNAALYERPVLSRAARLLAPGGMLAIWSAEPSPDVTGVLAEIVGHCEEITHTVIRDEREITYQIYLAALPPVVPQGG
jgi:spermidine synthase